MDHRYVTLAALQQLARIGRFDRSRLGDAIKTLDINPDKLDPVGAPQPDTLHES